MSDIHINIITPFPNNVFLRQLPSNLFKENIFFEENSLEDKNWDLVVVYEGVGSEKKLKCRKGGLVFISGEPPSSRNYSTKFIQQFDYIISSHPNIKHKNNILEQQALPWHMGVSSQTMSYQYNFEDFEKMTLGNKQKNISFITSNKKMMPGHVERMKFFEFIYKRYGELIDYYGKGINPIDDKAEALLNYKFNICIENCNINDYWTEKLADPFLAYTVPLYSGCTNIDKYFNINSLFLINIRNLDQTFRCIDKILDDPDMIYKNKIDYIKDSRDKILHKYNIYNLLIDKFNEFKNNLSDNYILQTIKPSDFFFDHKIKLYELRLKRLVYKIINN